jgi:hypothetical protein
LPVSEKLDKKDQQIRNQKNQIDSFKKQIKQLKAALKKVKDSPASSKNIKKINSKSSNNANYINDNNKVVSGDISNEDDDATIILKLKTYVKKQNDEMIKLKSQITKSWNLRKKMEASHNSSRKNILDEQKRLVNDQKRVLSRLRSSENSVQRSVEETKKQFRKEKKHLSEVINALVRSKQDLQLKYDVVLKKLSLQSISTKKQIAVRDMVSNNNNATHKTYKTKKSFLVTPPPRNSM